MAQDAQSYVESLYQDALGRTGAGDPGATFWADAIASGSMSREAVANAITQSNEAQILNAYQQELGRSGVGDPGAAAWAQAVEAGQIGLSGALAGISGSREAAIYDAYQNEWVNPGRPIDPDAGRKELEARLKQQELEFKQQMEAMRAQQQQQLAAQQRAIQQSQQMALQNKAIENAAQGQFTATAPLQGGVVPNFSGVGTGGAAPVTAAAQPVAQPIAPTPAQFVPQTYLAPAPPQYRNVNPFQVPFSNPFESYYSIATRRQGMPYPSPFVGLGQPVDGGQMAPTQGQPAPAQAQMASPFYGYPFQYYPAQQQGLPAGPTAPAAPTT